MVFVMGQAHDGTQADCHLFGYSGRIRGEVLDVASAQHDRHHESSGSFCSKPYMPDALKMKSLQQFRYWLANLASMRK